MSEVPNTQPDVISVKTIYEDDEKSVALVTLSGINRTIINRGSEMTYELISGAGMFDVNGQIHVLKEEGEGLIIPAGTQYRDEGYMVLRATSVPPFNPNDVEYLD